MGDEYRKEFISSNIVKLTGSTVIGPELVVSLLGKGLINDSEKDLLMDSRTPKLVRAMTLYTETANKWDNGQFDEFKKALQETGNKASLQVFTNAGADVFLTIDQVQMLKQQKDKSKEGSFEGLSLEDEVLANRIFQIAGRMFGEDGKFEFCAGLSRKEVVPLVKKFEDSLKNGIVWWNPRKSPLPKNYIERRVARTRHIKSYGSLHASVQPTKLVEIIENTPLILIVDPPGMGKSSEMSELENKLREKVISNRVILRVNLNEVQKTLATLSPSESASTVLLKLAPFIPVNIFETVGVQVFVLLDGLDEVCPKHQDTMINILRTFTSDNEPTFCKTNLRVIVTTRPHLREAVEKEFKLQSYSILPLTIEEQDEYMSSVLGVSSEQLRSIRDNLPYSVKDLLGNPLMLSMFADVINLEGTFPGGNILSETLEHKLNIFELYTEYVESKHKLQLIEKEGMRAEDNFTEMRLEGMFQRNAMRR